MSLGLMIYLFGVIEGLHTLAGFTVFGGSIVIMAGTVFYLFTADDRDDTTQNFRLYLAKNKNKVIVPVIMAMFFNILVPDQKTFVAIVAAPAIVDGVKTAASGESGQDIAEIFSNTIKILKNESIEKLTKQAEQAK
jgi:hypothetical protein